jgi:hypothetical protein
MRGLRSAWSLASAAAVGALAVVQACDQSFDLSPLPTDAGPDAAEAGSAPHDAGDAAAAADAARDADAGGGCGAAPCRAETPTFDPAGGTYAVAQQVRITFSPDPSATIHYTLDGTNPTAASPVYTGPIDVGDPCFGGQQTTTIRAFAIGAGVAPSDVGFATYVIEPPPGGVEPVQFSPGSGTFAAPLEVGLSSGVGATICYTLDGGTPACNSSCGGGAGGCFVGMIYSAGEPITLDGGTTTVSAVGCGIDFHTEPASRTYRVTPDGG